MFNSESKFFLVVWYIMMIWLTYKFLWGNAAEEAFDLSNRILKIFRGNPPSFLTKDTRENKNKAVVLTKVLAVIIFLLCTLGFIIAWFEIEF